MTMIDLPWPAKELSPNARPHHMAKHRATKKARALAHATCLEAGLRKSSATEVRITTIICPPTRGRFDDDNMQARCKAYFDGVADAIGVDDQHFRHSPIQRGEVRRGGAVCISIEVAA